MDKDEQITDFILNSAKNTEIDIYQTSEDICTRISTDFDYKESREKIKNENEAALILQNVNNLVYFSLLYQESNLKKIPEFELKKTFRKDIFTRIIDKELIDNYCFMKMKEKYEKTEEFKTLDRYINLESFDHFMRTRRQFLVFILNNPLLIYHCRYKEILTNYSSLLSNN